MGTLEGKNFVENWKELKDTVNLEELDWRYIRICISPLSEDFIREFKDKVNWCCISQHQSLSEDFIREFKDKVDWYCISKYQSLSEDFTLSEDFIREFEDRVDWPWISEYRSLSEDFIREFKDRVYLGHISVYQSLSEDFIREFEDRVDWYYISKHQSLSEEFIEKHEDKVDWLCISIYQSLSEEFIEKHENKVDWYWISKFQSLSKAFIEKHKDKVNWNCISQYQILTDEFIEEFNLDIDKENNWLYWDNDKKLKAIKDCGLYEIENDRYVIAYKSTKIGGISILNCQYRYEVGNKYSAHCDCNITHDSSFGLSAWTKEEALKYYSNGELYKVRVDIEKVGALVQNGNKLRCFEIEVLDKVQ